MKQRLSRCLWYHLLTFRELVRQRKLLVVHVLIIAGICLPLFILSGLKRGHVQELRRQLVSSPTGRQVTFWSATHGPILTGPLIESLQTTLPDVDLVIPEVRAVVGVAAGSDSRNTLESLTLHSTDPADPVLAQHGVGIHNADQAEVVLSRHAATALDVGEGDDILLSLHRRGDQTRSVRFRVAGVFPGNGNADVGFAGVLVMSRIQQYLQGYAVPDWKLPAKRDLTAPDEYTEYLILCRKTDDLSQSDRAILGERYEIERVEDPQRKSLYGMLSAERAGELLIYRLRPLSSSSEPPLVSERPSEIDRRTTSDEIVIAWNTPRILRINGEPLRVIGLSVSQRKWLAQFLAAPEMLFTFGDAERQIWRSHPTDSDGPVTLETPAGLQVPLSAVDPPGNASGPGVEAGTESGSARQSASSDISVACVPAPLLAHLCGCQSGRVIYDPVQQLFSPVPQPPRYDKARLYATTIDHVPGVVQQLAARKFAHYSESTRIEEIREQDASLDLLVQIVARVVSFFGILTVATVLLDSTARRRKDIGILRIMGVSGKAVLYMVMLRALVTGIAAALVAWGLAEAACLFLRWQPAAGDGATGALMALQASKPQALASIELSEDWTIGMTAIACSLMGSLVPGLLASRLDPIEALVSGKESQ